MGCIMYVLIAITMVVVVLFGCVIIHQRGAFGVAHFDLPGNARSLTQWNGQQTGSTFFFVYANTLTHQRMPVGSLRYTQNTQMEKRTIKFLTAIIVMVFPLMAHAQDIIVKKDGGTLATKVIEVGQSEVKYKKFNHQDGPTYTILKADVNYINYENGEKESFGPAAIKPQQSVVVSQEAQSVSDATLLKEFSQGVYDKKAKRLKTTAFIGGGVFLAGAVVTYILYNNDKWEDDYDVYDTPALKYASFGCFVACAGWTTGFLLAAKRQRNKAMYANTAVPIMQMELAGGKESALSASVNMMRDNISRQQTLGLGMNFKF